MESQTSKWKSDWMSKLKKPKKEQLVVLLLFGVLLVVIAIPTTPGKTTVGGESETISGAEAATDDIEAAGLSYEEQLEKRLSAILSRVAGAGRVEVMVTLESRGERIVEKDTPESRKNVEETDANGGKSPYVVKELEPNIEGVLVLAEGGGSAMVKQELLEAVQALFPIAAHKVKIMKLEGAK